MKMQFTMQLGALHGPIKTGFILFFLMILFLQCSNTNNPLEQYFLETNFAKEGTTSIFSHALVDSINFIDLEIFDDDLFRCYSDSVHYSKLHAFLADEGVDLYQESGPFFLLLAYRDYVKSRPICPHCLIQLSDILVQLRSARKTNNILENDLLNLRYTLKNYSQMEIGNNVNLFFPIESNGILNEVIFPAFPAMFNYNLSDSLFIKAQILKKSMDFSKAYELNPAMALIKVLEISDSNAIFKQKEISVGDSLEIMLEDYGRIIN